jgi:hypothetical protein
MSREQFDKYYLTVHGCLLASVKENHWRTWLAAQEAILSAHGPAVELRVIQDAEKTLDDQWKRLNALQRMAENEQELGLDYTEAREVRDE